MTRLFDEPDLPLAEGALLLRAFAPADELIPAIDAILTAAPFRHMITPGGFKMSVAMTNCGALGWVTDRKGYRYSPVDPESGHPWPPMPQLFQEFAVKAAAAAGYNAFTPDACLINRYAVGAKMSPHQDRDERDLSQPIVSVSLGIPAVFQFGGLRRADPLKRIPLHHGDVVVWGGPSRLAFHGVLPLKPATQAPLGPYRLNLTFRRAG